MPAPQIPTSTEGASHRQGLLAAVACNVLEFFDFVAYAFFAVQIGKAFFPATSPGLSLLLSVAVFGVGFVARPLGSLVIGHYADRVGRRSALLMTAVLMTVATLGLAITPSFSTIGIAAPISTARPFPISCSGFVSRPRASLAPGQPSAASIHGLARRISADSAVRHDGARRVAVSTWPAHRRDG